MKERLIEAWQNFKNFFNNFGWRFVLILCIIIISYCLIRFIVFIMKKILYKTKIDNAVIAFISALVNLILWILVILLIASLLEISMSSIVVALSSVALAVGLALKESLANLANGILIIVNKPFKRGDYVEVQNITGKIYNIKLLTTEIMTVDNKKITVPNSYIINNPVINSNAAPTRRMDKIYSVHYDSDMSKVENVLLNTLYEDKRILQYPTPSVFISNHNTSSIDYTVRFWVNTVDYWDVSNSLSKIVFDKFKENDITIPYNQLDIHMIKEDQSNEKNI